MELTVLSLFDGISCGQLALREAGIGIKTYFASEIDRSAIKVTQTNFPNTIQLGDVRGITGDDLPPIDLLIGGSPCVGFSVAGKGLNFEDPQSKLFFEFVRILKETRPWWFLLENVRMRQDWADRISHLLERPGPYRINSDRFVPQNRLRYYWTNIPMVFGLPERPEWTERIFQIRRTYLRENRSGVCPTLTANMGTGGNNVPLKLDDFLETDVDQKYFLTDHQMERYVPTSSGGNVIGRFSKYQGDRVVDRNGKAFALPASGGNLGGGAGNIIREGERFRQLTPVECEKLQGLPDKYTEGVSETSRYTAIGNGWTIPVVREIFRGMKLHGFLLDALSLSIGLKDRSALNRDSPRCSITIACSRSTLQTIQIISQIDRQP